MTDRPIRHDPMSVWAVTEPFRDIYAHAVEAPAGGRTLYVSGQIGIAADGTTRDGFAAQCNQALDNIEALLAVAGMTPADIVKLGCFLVNAGDLPALALSRQRWASAAPPAVTTIIVAALARPGLLVEIEAVAVAQ